MTHKAETTPSDQNWTYMIGPKKPSCSESPVRPGIHDSSFQTAPSTNSDHTAFWKLSLIYNGIDMCAISDSVIWDDAPQSSQTAALPL